MYDTSETKLKISTPVCEISDELATLMHDEPSETSRSPNDSHRQGMRGTRDGRLAGCHYEGNVRDGVAKGDFEGSCK
jgi:hypothetical protein